MFIASKELQPTVGSRHANTAVWEDQEESCINRGRAGGSLPAWGGAGLHRGGIHGVGAKREKFMAD